MKFSEKLNSNGGVGLLIAGLVWLSFVGFTFSATSVFMSSIFRLYQYYQGEFSLLFSIIMFGLNVFCLSFFSLIVKSLTSFARMLRSDFNVLFTEDRLPDFSIDKYMEQAFKIFTWLAAFWVFIIVVSLLHNAFVGFTILSPQQPWSGR